MGAGDPLVTRRPIYEALGRSAAERQREYRALFRPALDPAFVEALRAATNGGWAFGSEAFTRKIAEAPRRCVTLRPKGRPRKVKGDQEQLNRL